MKKICSIALPGLLMALGLIMTPGAKAALMTAEELAGVHYSTYIYGLPFAPPFPIQPEITKGATETEVLISNLFPKGYGFNVGATTPIKGIADFEKQTITFLAKQELGKDNYGINKLSFGSYQYADANDSTGKWTEYDSVTATIEADGTIKFPREIMIGCASSHGGFWYGFYDLKLTPYPADCVRATDIEGVYSPSFYWDEYDPNDEEGIDEDRIGQYIFSTASLAKAANDYQITIGGLFPQLKETEIIAAITPEGKLDIRQGQILGYVKNGEEIHSYYELYFYNYDKYDHQPTVEALIQEEEIIFPSNVTLQAYGWLYDETDTWNGYFGYNDLVLKKGIHENKVTTYTGIGDDTTYTIYDLAGNIVKRGADLPETSALRPGLYIVNTQGKTTKILVK